MWQGACRVRPRYGCGRARARSPRQAPGRPRTGRARLQFSAITRAPARATRAARSGLDEGFELHHLLADGFAPAEGICGGCSKMICCPWIESRVSGLPAALPVRSRGKRLFRPRRARGQPCLLRGVFASALETIASSARSSVSSRTTALAGGHAGSLAHPELGDDAALRVLDLPGAGVDGDVPRRNDCAGDLRQCGPG